MSEYNFFCKIKYALENSNLIVAAVGGDYNKIIDICKCRRKQIIGLNLHAICATCKYL